MIFSIWHWHSQGLARWRCCCAAARGSEAVMTEYLFGGIVACGLVGYLLVALLRPEKF